MKITVQNIDRDARRGSHWSAEPVRRTHLVIPQRPLIQYFLRYTGHYSLETKIFQRRDPRTANYLTKQTCKWGDSLFNTGLSFIRTMPPSLSSNTSQLRHWRVITFDWLQHSMACRLAGFVSSRHSWPKALPASSHMMNNASSFALMLLMYDELLYQLWTGMHSVVANIHTIPYGRLTPPGTGSRRQAPRAECPQGFACFNLGQRWFCLHQ